LAVTLRSVSVSPIASSRRPVDQRFGLVRVRTAVLESSCCGAAYFGLPREKRLYE
jgi:hypothetical protein